MKDRFGIDWSATRGTHFWRGPHLSRRVLFRHMAAAVGGYFLLPVRPLETVARAAATPIGKARNCIFIMMNGGPSHVDTFDLKTGPWTPAGFEPESYNGLLFPRGILPRTAEHLDHIALMRSVRAWAAVHQLAQIWLQIGRNPTAAMARIAPHIGSVVSLEMAPQTPDRVLPAFVSLNTGSGPANGFLEPEHAPFFVTPNGQGLGNTAHRDGPEVFARRYDLMLRLDAEELELAQLGPAPAEMAAFNASARRLMYNADVEAVFRFNADERARYGNTAFANACITARNLIRSRLGTRFVQITIGGWDNHSNIYGAAFNPNNQNALIRQFDNGLGALLADLKADGLLDETLVVAMGEFGRTVGATNSQGGRDHFLQQSILFAGAGIRGPKAIGATDDDGRFTVEPGWSRARDIRTEDVEATLYSALGIDWTTVRYDDPAGRGFEYVPFAASQDRYGPVHELWQG
jgi:hypothetical protein